MTKENKTIRPQPILYECTVMFFDGEYLVGQEVLSQKLNFGATSLNIERLNSGVYTYRISKNNVFIKTDKFIKIQ